MRYNENKRWIIAAWSVFLPYNRQASKFLPYNREASKFLSYNRQASNFLPYNRQASKANSVTRWPHEMTTFIILFLKLSLDKCIQAWKKDMKYCWHPQNLIQYEGCSKTIETLLVIHILLDGKLYKFDLIVYQHLFMTNIEEICKKKKMVLELYCIHHLG